MQRKQKIHLSLLDFDGTLTAKAGGEMVFSDEYQAVCTTSDIKHKIANALKSSREQMQGSIDIQEENRVIQDIVADCIESCEVIPELKNFHASILNIAQWTSKELNELIEVIEKLMRKNRGLIAQYENKINNPRKSDQPFNEALTPPTAYTTLDNLILLINAIKRLEEAKTQRANILSALEEKAKLEEAEHVYEKMRKLKPESPDVTEKNIITRRTKEILNNIQKSYENDPAFKMPEDAIQYLQQQLNDKNSRIHIISDNYQEFIQAVLLHNGFTWDQINRINIHDWRSHKGNKYRATAAIIHKYKNENIEIESLTICDDSANEFSEIKHAAESCGVKPNHIHGFTANPGKFDFEKVADADKHKLFKRGKSFTSSNSPTLKSPRKK